MDIIFWKPYGLGEAEAWLLQIVDGIAALHIEVTNEHTSIDIAHNE